MIDFSKPYFSDVANENVSQLLTSNVAQSDGKWAGAVISKIQRLLDSKSTILLTPSCTSALEIAALTCEIIPGDEVILPSYTFTSTVIPFVNRGVKLTFCEINPSSGCIDIEDFKKKISPKTKVVIAVHYGGWSCDIVELAQICKRNNIILIEDAAQSFDSSFNARALGTFGDLATFSFHYTKNIHCFEGGALVINNENMEAKAHICRDKGTNRKQYLDGIKNRYKWSGTGTSGILAELNCAYLDGQIDEVKNVTQHRREIWFEYHSNFHQQLKNFSVVQPQGIDEQKINGHIFAIKLNQNSSIKRDELLKMIALENICAVSHYEPLHLEYPRIFKEVSETQYLPITESFASSLVRLPIGPHLSRPNLQLVISTIKKIDSLISREINAGDFFNS